MVAIGRLLFLCSHMKIFQLSLSKSFFDGNYLEETSNQNHFAGKLYFMVSICLTNESNQTICTMWLYNVFLSRHQSYFAVDIELLRKKLQAKLYKDWFS